MAKNILHMITPLAHMSPFDVNMAIDAGYDATASYTNVSLDEVTDLIQDAMFSRSPRDAVRTGVFIGGKDALLALDMLDAAGKALFKPFEISLFADPAGSFTTAAAMIAVVEKTLKEKKDRALRGSAVSVFGATGVVGTASGVIAALEGASVTFVGRDGTDRTARHASEVNRRFGVNIVVADGSTPEARAAILTAAEVVLCHSESGRARARRRRDRGRFEIAGRGRRQRGAAVRHRRRGCARQRNAARRARRARRRRACDRQRQVSNRVWAVQTDDREQDSAAPRLPSGVRFGAYARVKDLAVFSLSHFRRLDRRRRPAARPPSPRRARDGFRPRPRPRSRRACGC